MLTPATRDTFHTLLDARTFVVPNDAPAITRSQTMDTSPDTLQSLLLGV